MPELMSAHIAVPGDMAAVFQIRHRVFIDEQGVDPDIEWDGEDGEAAHAVVTLDGETIGTGRLLKTDDPDVVRIGRMAVLQEHRRRGVGTAILQVLEERAATEGGEHAVLHAQTYVKAFYASHGYAEEGDPFEEAGIEHVAMSKRLGGSSRNHSPPSSTA
jgi:predicted GNAT family N-acyltransferase